MTSSKSWRVLLAASMVVDKFVKSDINLDDVRHLYESLPHLKQPLDLRTDEENSIPLLTEYRAIEKNQANAFHLKW